MFTIILSFHKQIIISQLYNKYAEYEERLKEFHSDS